MKISIITVVFNNQVTVRSAIESVLSQSYQPIEYIVIDGASTDGTVAILNEYRGQITYLVSEPDKGIYDAMNKGIRLATGDVIGILNSDDFYADSTVIQKVMSVFLSKNPDGAYGDLVYVTPNDLKPIRHWRAGQSSAIAFWWGWMAPHPALFLRKTVYDRFGLYDISYRIGADYEYMLRTMLKGKIQIQYLAESLVFMRSGGESNGSIRSRQIAFRENNKAWKNNFGFNNYLTVCLKILQKIPQYIKVWQKNKVKFKFLLLLNL